MSYVAYSSGISSLSQKHGVVLYTRIFQSDLAHHHRVLSLLKSVVKNMLAGVVGHVIYKKKKKKKKPTVFGLQLSMCITY